MELRTYRLCLLLSILAKLSFALEDFMFGVRNGGDVLMSPPVTKTNLQEHWVMQKLDHFHPTNEKTWSQRYFVNDEVYKNSGPAFLHLGGEGPVSPAYIQSGSLFEYAKNSGAILFALEHRFYGKSRPTEDLSVENLKYLSSEQSLADAAMFISWANGVYNLTDTKWVVFGGSYAGSLAAWLRLKYPHLVHGAVSSSAPILAQLDFKDYYRVVGESLGTHSAACASSVKKAFSSMSSALENPASHDTIDTLFNLCEPIKNSIDNPKNLNTFRQSLMEKFAWAVQYDKLDGSIDDVCSIMVNVSLGSPLERLATFIRKGNLHCTSYNYIDIIEDFKNTSWESPYAKTYRPWIYQTCTEFGFYQTSSDTNSVFGDSLPLEYFMGICQDIYNKAFNTEFLERVVNHTNVLYGGLNIEVSNVVFVHGSIDPWYPLGITETKEAGQHAIFIKGTSHCANLNLPNENDPPELGEAIKKIGNLIQSWLDQ